MLKKTITYKDLDGNSLTEDFYFNLTRAELLELEMTEEGGLRDRFAKLAESKNPKEMMNAFKMLISLTVGRRSEDGKRFEKSPEITAAFMQSEAYSVLFVELLQDPGAGARFIAGVMPQDLVEKVDVDAVIEKAYADNGLELPQKIDKNEHKTQLEAAPVVTKPKTLREYSSEELRQMPIKEFRALLEKEPGNNIPKHAILVAMQRAGE